MITETRHAQVKLDPFAHTRENPQFIELEEKSDITSKVIEKIEDMGGFRQCHAHLDRAFTIDPETLLLAENLLEDKWHLVDPMKASSSVQMIYTRMALGLRKMWDQGIKRACTFIDIDPVMENRSILAAEQIKRDFGNYMDIKFANQALKGVLTAEAKYYFELGAEYVDIIGGLPKKDVGREEEHLNVLLSTAKKMGKMVHVHVDQNDREDEKETELLARKTIEYGMEGRVVGIHCVSIAAQPESYRKELYHLMRDAGLMVLCCPTAWIDRKRNETYAPTHNSIAPVDELVPNGITVAIGADNIRDIYKPFTDGSMKTELEFLIQALHYYDIANLVKISTINGDKILGIDDKKTEGNGHSNGSFLDFKKMAI